MSKFKKIIFLDEENTMLSPYAEALMKLKLAKLGVSGLQIASRGWVVLFPEPVNQKVCAIAEKTGISLSHHKATALEESDFSDSTLVLTMDEETKNRIYQKYSGAVNVYNLKSYLEKPGSLSLPIGGTIEEYEAVCRELEGLLEGLIEKETSL